MRFQFILILIWIYPKSKIQVEKIHTTRFHPKKAGPQIENLPSYPAQQSETHLAKCMKEKKVDLWKISL